MLRKIIYFAFCTIILTSTICVLGETVSTEKWVGTNYTPAYACNQVQFWHDFRSDSVVKELDAAKKYFALNTLRVYLHPINFEQDKENFFKNLESFIQICAARKIKPGFTFFDDCHRHENIYLDKPTEPIKGYHNGRWAASPQDRDRDLNNLDRYKPYIQEIIGKYKNDNRILWWETFNEPNMKSKWSVEMRKASYKFAKEINPKQPIICCWDESPETDIVNVHNYTVDFKQWDRQTELNPSKGCMFTEAGARWFAPRQNSGEPVDVIRWLEYRKSQNKYTPGVYLCWELMVGNSNCRWYWETPQNSPEPTVPWCGLMWSDCTPVSLAESEAIRKYITGKSNALLFDDFTKTNFSTTAATTNNPENIGKWRIYSNQKNQYSFEPNVNKLESNSIQIANDKVWNNSHDDYILECRTMLLSENGNAGLIFRVNDLGNNGVDDFNGYYVGFDKNTLYLGKMKKQSQNIDSNKINQPSWNELQRFDLNKLECKVTLGVWNQIRIAVKGNQIRVWFNRMHESTDKENGLRINYTDNNSPVQKGTVGMRTFKCNANFDNIIVCPNDNL
ncbi:MAG: DUF1080 domain-containing protein [Planctomycetaceae bacterium]|nr:DUF1080 domain-containing protein [Planctomycetaceae bacterium]